MSSQLWRKDTEVAESLSSHWILKVRQSNGAKPREAAGAPML